MNEIKPDATAVVVNDEPTQLKILSGLLEKVGIAPVAFERVEAALEAMDATRPPSLIVTALCMPGLDGWRFCRLLRSPEYAAFNKVPILVVSATFAGDQPERIAADIGADAFLPSPVDGNAFTTRVRALLDGRQVRCQPQALIVDDDGDLACMLQRRFAAHGYRADMAHTIREAQAALSRQHYDVAVVDYHLPDGLADTLLDYCRAGHPDCACLMVTGDPSPELALDWMKRGAAAYLSTAGTPVEVEINERRIPWDGGFASLSVSRDITERKHAEEENGKLQAQLAQARKMESVGRLAGGVAHDFNNMLSVILAHAELALERLEPEQPLFADLQEVSEAAKRSADLTRQLLAFARKQVIAPRVVDLNASVEGMIKMLRRLIGEDIELAWQPSWNLTPVRVAPSQIDQILANLCVNARDAIAGVGKVTIETGNVSLDEAFCAARAGFVPGDYVMLAVGDNGVGMDAEILGHLFEPFFTTKAAGKGTGLGLATVYCIVKQNQGFIDAQSEPGRGTTFRIYLPRHQDVPHANADAELPEPALSSGGTILLVEDEAFVLRVTAMMLQKLGYTVIRATTPGEAIRLAREHAGQIDMLMTDLVMPEMNGRDLAANLLRSTRTSGTCSCPATQPMSSPTTACLKTACIFSRNRSRRRIWRSRCGRC